MMRRMVLLCLVSLFWISGCAIAPSSLAPEQQAAIRNLGVVSLIGKEINFTHVGLTVFGNSAEKFAVPEWGIDRHVAEVINATLQQRGAYQVSDLNYDDSALRKVYTGGVYNPLDFKKIEAEMRSLVQSGDLDALLFVTDYRPEDPIGGRSVYYAGMGLYSQGIGNSLTKVAPYVWYTLTVVDGKTLQPVASTPGVIEWVSKPLIAPQYSLPYREVDNSWWAASLVSLSGVQQQRLQDKLKEILSASLPLTLQELKLNQGNSVVAQ